MYSNELPEVEELVMVQVRKVEEMGTYVDLLEYAGMEGMVLHSELSRRRIRSIQKLIRIGKIEPMLVLRVDKEKRYVDLSKRRVAPEDVPAFEEKFAKSKMVHSIMRHVATKFEKDMLDILQTACWPMYEQYGHAHQALKEAILKDEDIFSKLPTEVPADIKGAILEDAERKFAAQGIRFGASVDVSFSGYEGVDAVKRALKAGMLLSDEKKPEEGGAEVSITLIAPPQYNVNVKCTEKPVGQEKINSVIAAIQKAIIKEGEDCGDPSAVKFSIRHEPRILGEMDENKHDDDESEASESEEEDETMGRVAGLDELADQAE